MMFGNGICLFWGLSVATITWCKVSSGTGMSQPKLPSSVCFWWGTFETLVQAVNLPHLPLSGQDHHFQVWSSIYMMVALSRLLLHQILKWEHPHLCMQSFMDVQSESLCSSCDLLCYCACYIWQFQVMSAVSCITQHEIDFSPHPLMKHL